MGGIYKFDNICLTGKYKEKNSTQGFRQAVPADQGNTGQAGLLLSTVNFEKMVCV